MSTTTVVNLRWQRYDVYIGRPGPFGNPFEIGIHGNRDQVISMHRDWLKRQTELIERIRRECEGKRLGCFCAPRPCHGDNIIDAITGALFAD